MGPRAGGQDSSAANIRIFLLEPTGGSGFTAHFPVLRFQAQGPSLGCWRLCPRAEQPEAHHGGDTSEPSAGGRGLAAVRLASPSPRL